MFLRVFILFLVLYIVLPLPAIRFAPEDHGTLHRAFITLTHSLLIGMAVVHLLALLKLFESLSILFVIILLEILFFRFARKGEFPPAGARFISWLLDQSDRSDAAMTIWRGAKDYLGRAILRRLRGLKAAYLAHPWSWLAIAATMIIFMTVRLINPIRHLYFGASDPYVHLQFVQSLKINQLYINGFYPYGFASILSLFSRFYLNDPYWIVRFIGPIGAFLILLSVYYFVFEVVRGPHRYRIAALAGLLYTLAQYIGMPVSDFRETVAVSMEFGAILMLPGVLFLIRYLESGTRRYLWLSAEALTALVIIHAFTAIAETVLYIGVLLLYTDKLLKHREWLRTLLTMTVAGVLGALPLILYELIHPIKPGTQSYLAYTYRTDFSGRVPFWQALTGWGGRDFGLWFVLLNLFVLAVWAGQSLRKRGESAVRLAFGRIPAVAASCSLLMVLVLRMHAFGLVQLIDSNRTGVFLGIMAAPAIAVHAAYLSEFIANLKWRGLVRTAVVPLTVVLAFSQVQHLVPPFNQFQYDEAVSAYLAVQRGMPFQSWAIVSPVEEYSLVWTQGTHYEIWQFYSDLYNASLTEEDWAQPTLVFFVEKHPLNVGVGPGPMVTRQEAGETIPPAKGDVSTYYYYTNVNRRVIESAIYYWAENYRKAHPDQMKIWRDDARFRVYTLSKPAGKPFNLAEARKYIVPPNGTVVQEPSRSGGVAQEPSSFGGGS